MSPPYHIKANFYQKVIDVTSRGQKIDFRKKELVNRIKDSSIYQSFSKLSLEDKFRKIVKIVRRGGLFCVF